MARPPSPFLIWPTRHPGWTLAAIVLVTLALAPGLGRLSFSNDIRVFFSSDNPQLRAYEQVEGTFAPNNSVLFVIAPRDGGTVFRPEILRAVADLTTEAWRLPHSRRVDSLTNFQNSTAEGDNLLVADLVPDAKALPPQELERIRRVALAEPLLVRRLISEDGTVTGVNASIRLPGVNPLAEQPEIALAARALAASIEQRHPAVDLRLTGLVMINQALSEETVRDATTLLPLMLAFIALAFGVLLRPWRSALAALLVILVSNFWAFALAGWLRIQLSPPVISAFNMTLTLAVAESVHLLNAYKVNLRHGMGHHAAMLDSLHSNVSAVFFTAFTTVLGFLSLNTSESPPFRDMGNIVAIGVTASWVLAQTLLPAVMLVGRARSPEAASAAPAGEAEAPAPAWMGRFAHWLDRHRRRIVVIGLGISITFGAFALKNETNDEFLEYFHSEVEFRRDTAFAIERLTGFEFIEFALETGQPNGIADPVYLRKLDAFAAWLRTQPKVRHVYAFSDIMKRLNRNLHGDDPAHFRLPEDRQAAAQYLLLYEMSLPAGQELTDQVSLDRSSSLLRISLANITSNEMIDLDRRAQAWLKENNLSPGSAGTGQSIMFAYIGERNIRSLLGGTIGGLVLIAVCMIFVVRSVRYGLLAIPPNVAPVALSFGLWYFADGRVGLAVSVVAGVTLGVVVDDTIHFVSKYVKFIRKGLAPVDAVRETFASTASAMVATTIILAGGFGILAFSRFELNQSMGILSAITIVLALFFDVFVMSALLLLVTPPRHRLTFAHHLFAMIAALLSSWSVRRRRALTFVLPALAGLCLATAMPAAEPADAAARGLAIAREAKRRDTGYGDFSTTVEMILRNPAGQETRRTLTLRTFEPAAGSERSLVVFRDPPDVAGTALLSHSLTDRPDDQWLFLPSLKRVRRIAAGNQSGSFVGSEFSYEDIAPQQVDKYTYTYLRTETFAGQECFVFARMPSNPKSGYNRQLFWVDAAEHRTLKVENYDRKDTLAKTLLAEGYTRHLDRYWRPARLVMTNHQSRKSTELLFRDYRFREGAKEADFDPESLGR